MYHFDWIRRFAERTPDRLAVVDHATDRRFTYSQWEDRILRLATFLSDTLSVQRGDRVSILAMNSSDYFELLFACAKVGAILNTLNWRLTVPELVYILKDCSPVLLVFEEQFAGVVDDVLECVAVERLLTIGDSNSTSHATLEAAIQSTAPGQLPELRIGYDETWAIIYTSGTTGRPKGAQVTYGNFFYNAVGMGQAISLTQESVNLNVLPTFHIGGLGLYACPTWHAGGTVVVMRAFDPLALLDTIARWRVTHLLLVPAIYLALIDYPGLAEADLSSIRSWGSGGSPLPGALVARYAERGITVQQGFGMTETGPTVFIIDREHAVTKAGSVGKPVLHTDVRIVDRDGRILPPGSIGELCVRGGNVTSGYWNRPDATAAALVDGWLHSGDAARCDEDGFYYIVDRWKDMYISGGENVYPAEVEEVLYTHPAVAEVAVIGTPHPRWQEVGLAVVVCKPGSNVQQRELIEHCSGKLARFKIPKLVVFRHEPLPRTAAGKVLKRELAARYNDPFIGSWRLDASQSRYEAGSPPLAGEYSISVQGSGYRFSAEWVASDGSRHMTSFDAIADEQVYVYDSTPGVDALSLHRPDDSLLVSQSYRSGVVTAVAERQLSPDHQLMIVTQRIRISDDQWATNVAHYYRQW